MSEKKKKYVSVSIPVANRGKTYERVQTYRFGKEAGELYGFALYYPKNLINEGIVPVEQTNGKQCDSLVIAEDATLKFTKRVKGKELVVNATVEEFKKIAEACIGAEVINSDEKTDEDARSLKRESFIRLFMPVDVRGKEYEEFQSYKLDDRFGDLSGFYFSVPKKMIQKDEMFSTKEEGESFSVDKINVHKGYTVHLKKGAEERAVKVEDLRKICSAAFRHKESKEEKLLLSEEEESVLNSSLEEGVFSDVSLNRQIVKNEKSGQYMVVSDDDVELRDFELYLTDKGKENARVGIKAGKKVFFDDFIDAKMEMYGANEALSSSIKSEDAAEIDIQYRQMVIEADGDEISIPSKKEFAQGFIRNKNWEIYQKYENDKAYERSTPYALRDKKIFVGWKFEFYDAKGNPLPKPAKVPYNPFSGGRATPTAPTTWSDFATAVQAVDKFGFNGIGVMLGMSKVMAIDIDHCFDADGKPSEMAKDIVDTVNSYAELSPSGEGLHILAFGKIPASKKLAHIEMYDEKRFITLTGHLFENKLRLMKSAEVTQPGLDKVWEKYVEPYISAETTKTSTVANVGGEVPQEEILSDEQILHKIEYSERTKLKFERLRQGLPPYEWDDKNKCYTDDINQCWFRPDGTVDASDVDTAFVKMLVYFNATPAQIDRIYRQNPLARPKWDEKRGAMTYGERIMANAYVACSKRYGFFMRGLTSEDSSAQTVTSTTVATNENINE